MAIKTRTTAVLIAFIATPLFANNHPAGQMVLALVSILPLVAILTAIGGGYAVMRRMNRERYIVGKTAGVFFAILFAGVSEGFTFLVVLMFSVAAIVRGIHMIQWGMQAREADPEGPLRGVKPTRMITAGVLIFPIVLVLLSMTFAFVGAWDMPNEYRYPAMRKYVAYRLALRTPPSVQRTKLEEEAPRHIEYYGASMQALGDRGYRLEENGTHFVVYLLPNVIKFPFPPYDRWFSARTYRADDTGAIRMAYVRSRELCPANAPIVDRVGGDDIKKVLDGQTDFEIPVAPPILTHHRLRSPAGKTK